MTQPEALRIVAMLTAYHRQELSNETALLWAQEIVEFELEDAMEATRLLGIAVKFMPSLATFIEAIRECRNERRAKEGNRPMLQQPYYPFTQYLAEHPEMIERAKALQGTWPGDMFTELLRGEIAHGKAVRRRAERRQAEQA